MTALTLAHTAVLGAAFKPESDDVRDSPALDIAARLHSIGADVHVYDPKANENAAKRYPRVDYASSLIQAVARAEVVVLLTEWEEPVGWVALLLSAGLGLMIAFFLWNTARKLPARPDDDEDGERDHLG